MKQRIYYFAYGQYLSKKKMLERCPDSKPLYRAALPNYRLIFTGWSRQWRGGTPSLVHTRGEKVAGAVYEVSERDLRRLDEAEGYPRETTRLNVIVFDEDGNPTEAVTYIKTGRMEEGKPSLEYATILKEGYREWGII